MTEIVVSAIIVASISLVIGVIILWVQEGMFPDINWKLAFLLWLGLIAIFVLFQVAFGDQPWVTIGEVDAKALEVI